MPDFGQTLDSIPASLLGSYIDSYGDIVTITNTTFSVEYTNGYSESYTFVTIYEKRIIIVDENDYKSKVIINEDGSITYSSDTFTKQTTTE